VERSVLSWVLITTTALIFGKALKVLDIEWFWAFFPFTFTILASMLLLLITKSKDGKE
jgi:hypothetical protein